MEQSLEISEIKKKNQEAGCWCLFFLFFGSFALGTLLKCARS